MGADTVHPTDQILRSYGLGKLDDASAESVSKHLESCAPCQGRVAEMSSDTFSAGCVAHRAAGGVNSGPGAFVGIADRPRSVGRCRTASGRHNAAGSCRSS